jgi:hypothetical protein
MATKAATKAQIAHGVHNSRNDTVLVVVPEATTNAIWQ